MDLYSNKKFKITRYALTREETLDVTEKHKPLDNNNKVFILKKRIFKSKIF